MLKCADCGSALAYSHKELKDGTSVGVYRCTKYINNGKVACSVHRIQENTLEAIVLADIRAHAQIAAEDRQRLKNKLLATLRNGQKSESVLLRKQHRDIANRQEAISDALKNLYIDKCTGKLPEAVFQSLMNDFTREQTELDNKSSELSKRLLVVGDAEDNVREWFNRIDDCLNLEKLDRDTVTGLIESIIIHEGVKTQGQRTQEIEIYYRFVGSIASKNTDEDIA
ncbi:MAG: DUF4368 domain-containing protein [Clostridia bacterium]|nr:DUF4368 domain-containing protein [Clostridia bacterium]